MALQNLDNRTIKAVIHLLGRIVDGVSKLKGKEDKLRVAINEITAFTGWPVGHVYIWKPESKLLVSSGIWHLEDKRKFKAFKDLTEKTTFKPGKGLPGRTFVGKKGYWITNLQEDKNFPRARAGIDIGLQTGFGLPVLAGGEVFAVLEFFSPDIVEEDTYVLTMLEEIGSILGIFSDLQIAEKETDLARQSLKDREEFLRTVVNTMVDGLVVINKSGVIIETNQACRNIFGYHQEEELQGKNINILMPKPDRDQHNGYIAKFLKTGKGKIIGIGPREVTGLHKSGKKIDLEIAVETVTEKGQQVFVGSLRDVSLRKEAEERYKMLADFGNDIIFLRDEKNKTVYISPAITRHLGCDPRNEIGKETWNRVHPDDAKKLKKEYAQAVLVEKKSFMTRVRLKHEDGHYLWFEGVSQPILNKAGNIKAVVTAARNIDKQRAAEEESLSLGRIIEESKNEIYILDYETLNYVFVNRGARENLGFSLKELRQMKPWDINPERTPESAKKILEQLRTGKNELLSFESQLQRKNGTIYDTEVKMSLARAGDRPVIVSIIEDITEKKEQSEQLKQAQKMEAIGNLSGGIAHDFNNLLTAIQGSLQLLELTEGGLSKDGRELLNIAQTSTRKGADLTHRLLAFSRTQSLSPAVIEINKLLKDFMPFLQRTLGGSIEIETHLIEKKMFIEVDKNELENAILNLSVNARDAMLGAGHLAFEINEIEVTQLIAAQREIEPGQYVVVSVSDSGGGMSPEVQKKIFEPFFTTKEEGKGTGLGLSMVFGFVKQSGGHVTVYSEMGKGTTFKLYLRKTTKTKNIVHKKTKHLEVSTKEQGTVLLVEDNREVLDFVAQALKTKGYVVLKAEHGPASIAIMKETPNIDLLLTDIVLPKGMDGLDIGKKFKKMFPLGKVIYSSGFTGKILEKGKVLKAGDDFLAKPYDLDDLYEKVSSKLQNKKP